MLPVWEGVPNSTPSGYLNAGLLAIRANPPAVDPAVSAATLHPYLLEEWAADLNGDITLDKVFPASARKFWWKCPVELDHIWQATLGNRAYSHSRCPCCAGRQLSVTNSLATLHPDLAVELDDVAMGGLSADMVLGGTKTVYPWRCPIDSTHLWSTSPYLRVHDGVSCPFCLKEARSKKSLLRLYPAIAAQWHPTANGDLTADDVTYGSAKKFWWQCADKSEHEWQAMPCNRTGQRKSGCPYCALESISCGLKGVSVRTARAQDRWGLACPGQSHAPISPQLESISTKLAERVATGRAFHSNLEKDALPLLSPLGYGPHAIKREAHRFDLGNPDLGAVVEINGCYWHDHQAIKAECPVRPRAILPSGRTCWESDERTRAIAARHGLALLELWGCEKVEWPAQIASFAANLQASSSS